MTILEHHKNIDVTIVAFSCKPHAGSEWGVGWNYVLILSKIFKNVNLIVRDSESQVSSIRKELIGNKINNVNLVAITDLKLPSIVNVYLTSGRFMLITYHLWLLKCFYFLLKNHDRNSYFFHVTFVSDWIWSPFYFLRYKFKVIGPIGSQPANFYRGSVDYYFSRIRYITKAIIRLNPLNLINALLADRLIAIGKTIVQD
jgi:hypothetical protein